MTRSNIFDHLDRWAPPIIIMIIIFVVSSMPILPKIGDSNIDIFFKKAAHFTEYLLLFLSWHRAIIWRNATSKITLFTSALITFIYALSDEYHQSFVPGRVPAVMDIIVDSLGIIVGIAIAHNKQKIPIHRDLDQNDDN